MDRKIKRLLCSAVFLVSLGSFLLFAVLLSRARAEYRRGEEDLKSLRAIRGKIVSERSEPAGLKLDEASRGAALTEEKNGTEEGYKRLYRENPDMVGWIWIDGSPVDYPVMQTPEEPDFYLRRGFDKEYSIYGMIYMDAGCDLAEGCNNYVLYGHHMKNGSMFASIEKYKFEEYWREHPVFQLNLAGRDGLTARETYEVLAAFRMQEAELDLDFANMLAAGSEEEYNGLINYIHSHRLYSTGVTAKWPDQLATLATCEYTQKDGRFFVVGRKRRKQD